MRLSVRSVKESVANTILKHIKMHSKILCDREKGAFGRVFLAKKDGKEYALKETLSSGRKATKAAQRESKLIIYSTIIGSHIIMNANATLLE